MTSKKTIKVKQPTLLSQQDDCKIEKTLNTAQPNTETPQTLRATMNRQQQNRCLRMDRKQNTKYGRY